MVAIGNSNTLMHDVGQCARQVGEVVHESYREAWVRHQADVPVLLRHHHQKGTVRTLIIERYRLNKQYCCRQCIDIEHHTGLSLIHTVRVLNFKH